MRYDIPSALASDHTPVTIKYDACKNPKMPIKHDTRSEGYIWGL